MGEESSDSQVNMLTNVVELELKKQHALREAGESRRREQEKKERREDLESLKTQLLEAQLSDQKEKTKTRSNYNKLLATVVTMGSSFAVFVTLKLTVWKPDVQAATQVVEKAEKAVVTEVDVVKKDLAEFKTRTDKKFARIVEIQLDAQVQQSDGHGQIIESFQKAHPRTATVDEPPSVQAGRIKAQAIKNAPLKPTYDPADPLADL